MFSVIIGVLLARNRVCLSIPCYSQPVEGFGSPLQLALLIQAIFAVYVIKGSVFYVLRTYYWTIILQKNQPN